MATISENGQKLTWDNLDAWIEDKTLYKNTTKEELEKFLGSLLPAYLGVRVFLMSDGTFETTIYVKEWSDAGQEDTDGDAGAISARHAMRWASCFNAVRDDKMHHRTGNSVNRDLYPYKKAFEALVKDVKSFYTSLSKTEIKTYAEYVKNVAKLDRRKNDYSKFVKKSGGKEKGISDEVKALEKKVSDVLRKIKSVKVGSDTIKLNPTKAVLYPDVDEFYMAIIRLGSGVDYNEVETNQIVSALKAEGLDAYYTSKVDDGLIFICVDDEFAESTADILQEKYKWSFITSNGDPTKEKQKAQEDVPAETKIKVSGESAGELRAFVNKVVKELDEDPEITTFFIDTPAEYKKFDIQIPGICLVVTDLSETEAALKAKPVVKKFDKSKTLKRYSVWQKGKVPGFDDKVWYTIYVSAKEAHANNITALHEEYFGYLDEEGDVICMMNCNEETNEGARITDMRELEEKYVEYRVDGDGNIWVK